MMTISLRWGRKCGFGGGSGPSPRCDRGMRSLPCAGGQFTARPGRMAGRTGRPCPFPGHISSVRVILERDLARFATYVRAQIDDMWIAARLLAVLAGASAGLAA